MFLKTLHLTAQNYRYLTRLLAVESCIVVPVQHYARFTPRKGRIVNENELFDVSVEPPTPTPRTVKPKYKPKSKTRDTKECNEELGDNLSNKINDNKKLMSTIMMSMTSKKHRKKKDEIILEGKRLIKDAIEANVKLETLMFSRIEDIGKLPIPNSTKKLKVPYRTIQLWSTLSTSPGIMGIFQKPLPLKPSKNSLPITVILDNIRDPGNMGSILRAAAGVGVEKVILTKGCVDFWDPKVVRSAAGAHFCISIHSSLEWEKIYSLLNDDARVYIADNKAYNLEDDDDDDAIFEEEEENKDEVIDEEKNKEYKKDRKKQKKVFSKSKQPEYLKKLNILRQLENVPLLPYYAVDYSTHGSILIIGGETEGLSEDSCKFAQFKNGVRVNIPLDNGVDSLNSGMALGIVAFEIKRQYLKVQAKLKLKQTQ